MVHALAKILTNTGVHILDFCFLRAISNFLSGILPAIYSKIHFIHGVPKNVRFALFRRSLSGVCSFGCLVCSISILPLFITNIVFNTMPFWTSILLYFWLKESVTKYDLMCMLGCFAGVIIIAFSKQQLQQEDVKELTVADAQASESHKDVNSSLSAKIEETREES